MGHQPDGRHIVAIDVDEHDPNASGGELLHQLEQEHGPLPPGPRSITGAGGAHILLETAAVIRNGTLGPGLDIRGEGGQIVVAPSIHPVTQVAYGWEDLAAPWDMLIPVAPAQWVRLLDPPASSLPRTPPPTGPLGDTPAEWLRHRWNWQLELERVGWEPHHQDSNGDQHWTRPGKPLREGASAILHSDGPLVVFSTDPSMGLLRQLGYSNRDGSVSITPLEYAAAYHYGGDIRTAARNIRQQMPPPPRMPWVEVAEQRGQDTLDQELLAQVVNWEAFWTQDQGTQGWLAYPILPAGGRSVALYAPAKAGKSWITLACAAAAATGRSILGDRSTSEPGPHHILYLDYEMTADDISARLMSLGYGPDDDMGHLHYVLSPALPPLNTEPGRDQVRRLAALCQAEAVIIDTMGRAVVGEENSADPYRDYARMTGMLLKGDGISVLRTDHAGKNKERGQRGSSAKNDDVDVVMSITELDNGWRLTRTYTRIAWVPESVTLQRVTHQYEDGDHIEMRLAPESKYKPMKGTAELVRRIKAAGFTYPFSRDECRAAGIKARNDRFDDAARWMRAEVPEFGGNASTEGGDTTNPPSTGTQTGTQAPSYPLTGVGTRTGTRGDTTPAPRGDTATLASSGRDPGADPGEENLF
jgi:hypothetical protein